MFDHETQARLRWRCRRGMLELDVLLNNFLNDYFYQLTQEEQGVFSNLLESEDQDLYAWLLGYTYCQDETLGKLIQKIKTHATNSD